MRDRKSSFSFYPSISAVNFTLSAIFLVFLASIWYVSDPARAVRLDRYILYSIDDILRYCHIRVALTDISIFFNIYLKFLYALIATFFYHLIPIGMPSLRIMNSLFSVATLFLLYKLTKVLGFQEKSGIFAILITTVFPIYFLLSVSAFSEPIFSFFLILSLLALYREQYGVFSISISLLPLIRQPANGLLYLELGIFILILKKPRLKYFFMLLVPTVLWCLFNVMFLKRTLMEIFFFNLADRPQAPLDSIMFLSEVHPLYFIGFYPLLLLSIIGIFRKIPERKFLFVFSYILAQLIFIVLLNIIDYQTSGCIQQEYRVFMPIIPLLAIYETVGIDWVLHKFIRTDRYKSAALGLIGLCLFVFSVLQLQQLQKSPKLMEEKLSYKQEKELQSAARWLNAYLKENNISNVYGHARELIREPIRKLWMYLDKGRNMYFIYMNVRIFDVLTWKVLPSNLVNNGVFVFTLARSEVAFEQPDYKLIKAFPDIPLYFYVID